MKTLSALIASVAVSFLMSSCTTYVTTSTFNSALPDSTFESSAFYDADEEYVLDYTDLGPDSIRVYVYQKTEVLDNSSSGNSIFSIGSEDKYDFCAAVFKQGKLFYWGYIDDFKKDDDPVIRQIGERVSEKLINEY